MNYQVRIYGQPLEYDIEAPNMATAEDRAMQAFNGGNYQDIRQVEVIEIKDEEL